MFRNFIVGVFVIAAASFFAAQWVPRAATFRPGAWLTFSMLLVLIDHGLGLCEGHAALIQNQPGESCRMDMRGAGVRRMRNENEKRHIWKSNKRS